MLVSAVLSPNGAPAEVFEAGEAGSFEPVASEKLLAELEAVLLRQKFRRYLSEDEARGYVGRVRSASTMVPDPAFDPGLTPDPKDDYLVALARAASAHLLVSGDPHLTRLEAPDPPVLVPRQFLETLRA